MSSGNRPADARPEHLLRALLLAVGAGLTLPFLVNLCDWIFDCGCRSLWNGADALCNVHDPGTHDCPWCATGWIGFAVPTALILGAQAAVAWWPGTVRGWRPFATRLLLMVVTWLVVGGAVGVGFGLATGYWG